MAFANGKQKRKTDRCELGIFNVYFLHLILTTKFGSVVRRQLAIWSWTYSEEFLDKSCCWSSKRSWRKCLKRIERQVRSLYLSVIHWLFQLATNLDELRRLLLSCELEIRPMWVSLIRRLFRCSNGDFKVVHLLLTEPNRRGYINLQPSSRKLDPRP